MTLNKQQLTARYLFAFSVLLLGIVLEGFNVGKEFLGFSSVGMWLIYVGAIMFAVITLQLISNRKRIVDERMEKLAHKAARITFVFIIMGAFFIMIFDAIKPITIPYSMFMSHMICWIVLVYFVSYKILLKYY